MRFTQSKAFICILLVSLLASCTFNPFSHDNDLTGNPLGIVGGAAAGAGTAAVLGASKPVIGIAGIGGAGIGYYVTTLRFASGGIIYAGGQVFVLGDSVTIEIPSDKLFDPNSAELRPDASAILDSVVTVLQRYPDNNIMISGNTSGFGTQKFEHRLSQKRAERVAAYLWAHSVNEFKSNSNETRRVTYVGYGNFFPIANNIKANSIRKNNRIQITAYPSRRQLEIEKGQGVFENIGNGHISVPQNPRQPQIGSEFTSDRLPEKSGGGPLGNYKGVYNSFPSANAPDEGTARQYYKEEADTKGESWGSYNSISTERQTSKGVRSVKQGGYKGFSNFKDE